MPVTTWKEEWGFQDSRRLGTPLCLLIDLVHCPIPANLTGLSSLTPTHVPSSVTWVLVDLSIGLVPSRWRIVKCSGGKVWRVILSRISQTAFDKPLGSHSGPGKKVLWLKKLKQPFHLCSSFSHGAIMLREALQSKTGFTLFKLVLSQFIYLKRTYSMGCPTALVFSGVYWLEFVFSYTVQKPNYMVQKLNQGSLLFSFLGQQMQSWVGRVPPQYHEEPRLPLCLYFSLP